MIRDLGDAGAAPLPPYDVCIIGSGPAGLTVARELASAGLRLCVLESGGRRTTRAGDALREVHSDGIRIKPYSRERVLGGASTTWGGLGATLDPVDMSARPFLAMPGWPITRDELLPYWVAATERYGFAPLRAYGPDGFGAIATRGDVRLTWRDVEEKVLLAASEPLDFGQAYQGIFAAPDVDLWLDATVLRLERGAGGALGPIRRAVARTLAGREVAVEATAFVLATGGLENPRLLLASQDLCPAGLGNERDQVGRGLMNHPKQYAGVIDLTRPVRELPYHFGCMHRGFAGYAGLRLREDLQRARGLLNSYVRFEPMFPWSDNPGVASMVFMVKRSGAVFERWKAAQRDKLVSVRDYAETGDDSDFLNNRKTPREWLGMVGTIGAQAPMVARYALARLREDAPPVTAVRLRNFMEMEPHPDNRVTLSDAVDALGQRVPLVRHRPTALDRRSLVALHAAMAHELTANGFGTLTTPLTEAAIDAEPWPIDGDASHHMGTTRMGLDPATSVVNADARLHDVANVFVAGASVFATSGCANPTFTLVALAIRLAAHLRATVPRRAGASVDLQAMAAALPDAAPRLAPRAAAPTTRRPVLIVGAGWRVQTDVLPALERLADAYEIAGVFARAGGVITSQLRGASYATRPLDSLTAADLAPGTLVYLAVSKSAVPKVLAQLTRHDVRDVDLLLETPGLLPRDLHHAAALDAFHASWAAEDCTTLPWLATVRAAAAHYQLGALREVVCDRSAYRYHGVALLKTLLDDRALRTARRTRGPGKVTRDELQFAGGGAGVLIEPRDYATGSIALRFDGGDIADGPTDGLRLEPMLGRGAGGPVCVGFRIGEVTTAIDIDDSALIGELAPGRTVTAAMDTMKRAGLARLLRAVHGGGAAAAYPIAQAIDDSALGAVLARVGRWQAHPWLATTTPIGRVVLGAISRVGRG